MNPSAFRTTKNRHSFPWNPAGIFLFLLWAPLHAFSPDSAVSDLPLEQKIGQMILVGFTGTHVSASHPLCRDIEKNHLGGVLLSGSNIEERDRRSSGRKLKDLIRFLQALSPVPLFVAVDYEGGFVSRFDPGYGFPALRSAKSLGLANDVEATAAQASVMAGFLADLGVNLNLAPVVDLALNPSNEVIVQRERSYSSDPYIVTDHARAFIRAHRENGVFCALKHYPGHGSSADDTHLGRTDITDTWTPEELIPYRKLIREGLASVIMTAHVSHRRIDRHHPATLSGTALTAILRGQLRYDGLILSDDMNMKAVVQEYGIETAVIRAVNAGVDILMFTYDPGAPKDFVGGIVRMLKRAVEEGRIPEERIEASHRRIVRLKSRCGTMPAIERGPQR